MTPTLTPDRRRAADVSAWVKAGALVARYKVLFWGLGILAVSAGYGFRTPAQTNARMQQQIDAMRADVDSLRAHEQVNASLLRTLIEVACLDHAEQVVCRPYLPRPK